MLQRIQAGLSWGLPLLVLAAITLGLMYVGASRNNVAAAATLMGISIYLAVFLHQRSRGREAKFVVTRVGPEDDEATQDLVDVTSIVCAAMVFALAALLWFV